MNYEKKKQGTGEYPNSNINVTLHNKGTGSSTRELLDIQRKKKQRKVGQRKRTKNQMPDGDLGQMMSDRVLGLANNSLTTF